MAKPQEVDVQQVMERIRDAIRRRRSNEEAPPHAAVANGALPPGLAHLQSLGELGKVTIASHRRLFGQIVVTVKKILLKLLTPILEQQAAYNAAAVRAIADTDNRMQAMEWRYDHALAKSLEQLAGSMAGDIAGLRAQVQDDLDRLRGAVFARLVEEVDTRHAALRQEVLAATSDLYRQLAAHLESSRTVDARLAGRLAASERKWRRVVHLLEAGPPPETRPEARGPANGSTLPPAELEPEFDYGGFEDRFRGDEADIKERQRIYLPYFAGAANVVDVGCGRGEFLELLRESGIKALGVDVDLDMVLQCRDKGLDAVREDAFAHLAARGDESVGGIFSAQFIEHLEPQRIVELVKLAHRKLAPGGWLVLETPNPACLMVFADSFYRDLSHIRPVHSETMKFLLEATGFLEVDVKPLAPVDPAQKVPPIQSNDPTVAAFNQGIDRLNALLFGFQDYAVIGRKGWASRPDA